MDFSSNDANDDLHLRLGGCVLLFDQQDSLLLVEDSDPTNLSKGSW